ncbi:hypothetical protein O1L68_08825 [Streptomyces lydicus]|nr:hypothetical protein [Streptomyces lydicus]MCZ1006864.1 hypothetical protein [Streptomyces lydicus]
MPLSPSPHDHQQRLEQLAAFIRESDQILADWDDYSDQHTDLDGWPHDEDSYAQRAGARDADVWKAFNRIRHSAKALVATAEAQLQRLPAQAIQSRWVWQLSVLESALDRLNVHQDEWLVTRDSLHPSARPGTELYDNARARRNAEAWPELNEWASAGEALLEIHRAAEKAPSPLATTPPVRVPTLPASASHTITVRR